MYIGQNEWTHVNCAIWSAEVFEENDGSLKNVHAAVARGRQMVRARVQRGGQLSGSWGGLLWCKQLLLHIPYLASFHCQAEVSWLPWDVGADGSFFLCGPSGCNLGLKCGSLKVRRVPID